MTDFRFSILGFALGRRAQVKLGSAPRGPSQSKIQNPKSKMVWLLGALLVVTGGTGCLQIEARLKVHEDGSATLTERLSFSRRLLDLAGAREQEILELAGKDAALERMKQMGSGVTLIQHELRDGPGASKESVVQYKVADVSQFLYVSPWFAYLDYPANNAVEIKMYPLYKSNPYRGGSAGSMAVLLKPIKPPKGDSKEAPPLTPPSPPWGEGGVRGAPKDLQVLRELGPVARDMLKGLRLRFTFEAYAPVHSALGVRDEGAGATAIDLLDVSDTNLDNWGGPFLENEEVMLDLMRGEFGSANVVRHVQGYWANNTLPVFMPRGSRHIWWLGAETIWFAPSRPLFDKHFAGKKLDYSEWQPHPPEKHVPADFDNIGWKGLKR